MNIEEKTTADLINEIRVLHSRLEVAERERIEESERSDSKLQKVLWETIHGLASLIKARNQYSALHHQEVSTVACHIAKELGMSKRQTDGICMAALVHDIGKINLPPELLEKTSNLTKAEFDMVKEHPRIGYEVLKKIEFEAPVATIVLQHHENLNGTGYPSGLFGNKILIESRIILVADSLEAMTSPRTFRLAYSLSDALEELSRQSGILYDSNVVKACKRLF